MKEETRREHNMQLVDARNASYNPTHTQRPCTQTKHMLFYFSTDDNNKKSTALLGIILLLIDLPSFAHLQAEDELHI